MNNLHEYNIKRNFNKTPEPKANGKIVANHKKLKFVVQYHLARKEHYDFRLEHNGVLVSFAIPKGFSYNPSDKRLAIRVENHPYSYRNFEGAIPKGSYGAGVVMVWDYGNYEIYNNYNDYSNGPLKVVLYGKRLKGRWTLIKLKDNNWLLIKEKDKFNEFNDIKKLNTSIKTNRTIEEIVKKETHVKLSHGDKIFYKNACITKKDVYDYYKLVATRMLPFVGNRVLSVLKCPQGIENNKFFHKHLHNDFLGLITINNKNKKEDYYYVLDEVGILSEVQMNSIEFHIGSASIKDLEHPKIMVFDLDPDENVSLEKLREGVKDLKKILDSYNLKSYLKTSGGKGYHVVVPFKNKIVWSEFTLIAKNIALLMEEKWPDKYTSNIRLKKRKEKIFIDWLRNTKNASFIAPYSLRARENAPISMPIKWSELDKVKPNEITINDIKKRLKRVDPWKDFFK